MSTISEFFMSRYLHTCKTDLQFRSYTYYGYKNLNLQLFKTFRHKYNFKNKLNDKPVVFTYVFIKGFKETSKSSPYQLSTLI